MTRRLTLPTDSSVRKDIPLYSGCYTYFPAALAGVALHSKLGNDKHNPGEPLHHARGKSMDHADCIARHSMDIADFMAHRGVWTQAEQDAILVEANAMCWRALALSQELHEKFGAPLAPAARLPEKASQGDYLGRRIREYNCEGRVHQVWCGLDSDHAGNCVPCIATPGETEPAKACSGSPASEPTPIQFYQTPFLNRVSSHGQSQEPKPSPPEPSVLPHRD